MISRSVVFKSMIVKFLQLRLQVSFSYIHKISGREGGGMSDFVQKGYFSLSQFN
jgi:hypothetical protein